ncbi:MAG: alpha/beta hydrolase [Xanthomonadales bacterium]|nr:alpha/beta hydrolase [Xanthomonadales bacterium]
MSGLTAPLQSWLASGHVARVDDVALYYRQAGTANADHPWLVCFHGFPTSSWDWHALLPLLAKRRKVLVFDFPGYGLSEKPPNRGYSLKRQLDAAEALFRHLRIERFELLAHDMGNSVACELLRRREAGGYPFELQSLTLLNGGIYMDQHRPLFTQRLLRTPGVGAIAARLTSWRLFRLQYPRVYANPEQFDPEHYASQWALLLNNDGRRTLHRIAGYMKERTRMGEAWTGPLHRLDLPLKVIWGREDPIAVYGIAETLCRNQPGARLVTLEGIGHYPQLEAPERVAKAYFDGQ